MVEQCFKTLRESIRTNGKNIIDHIKRNHFEPGNFAGENDICSFCGSEAKGTKEHVIPRWAFSDDTRSFFITNINETQQTFIKTVIPACANCNNCVLAEIEKYIVNLFKKTDLDRDYFQYEELLDVIRWLEIIEYKFHILEFRRKFKKKKSAGYIPFLRDVPMSVMRTNIDLSPYKALAQLRASQARIRRKEKDSRYFSLLIYKTKNKERHFFHNLDEFIFFEFPQFKLAMFYFFKEEFKDNFETAKRAEEIISRHY